MTFRYFSTVTIAIYVFFTFLWMGLFTKASREDEYYDVENFYIPILEIPSMNTTQEEISLDIDVQLPYASRNNLIYNLIHSIKSHIFSKIINEFLTIRDVLILRNTCTHFKTLLFPNDNNMVMFCKNFESKEMDNVPLIWLDLKYFFAYKLCE